MDGHRPKAASRETSACGRNQSFISPGFDNPNGRFAEKRAFESGVNWAQGTANISLVVWHVRALQIQRDEFVGQLRPCFRIELKPLRHSDSEIPSLGASSNHLRSPLLSGILATGRIDTDLKSLSVEDQYDE